jgi:hypothetical protein
MKLKRKILLIIGLVILTAFTGGICSSAMAEENQGAWHKVGTDVKATARAVGEATKETYEKTKEKSKETWQETKKGGKEALKTGKEKSKGFWHSVKDTVKGWYEDAKASVHSATASKDEKKEPEKSPDASSAPR